MLDLLTRRLSLSNEQAFLAISFSIVLTFALILLKYSSWTYLLLLVNPLIVDLAFSQMRSGLAVSIALWAYLIPSRRNFILPLPLLLLAVAVTMHTSVALLSVVFLVTLRICSGDGNKQSGQSYFKLVALGVATGMLMGLLRGEILAALDDRRMTLEYSSTGGKFLLIWLLLLVILSADWSNASVSLPRAIALVALTSVFVGLPFGSYSSRVIALSLPFLLTMISDLTFLFRHIAVIAYLAYLLLQWSYWLRFLG